VYRALPLNLELLPQCREVESTRSPALLFCSRLRPLGGRQNSDPSLTALPQTKGIAYLAEFSCIFLPSSPLISSISSSFVIPTRCTSLLALQTIVQYAFSCFPSVD
jgi:hypothetical protein